MKKASLGTFGENIAENYLLKKEYTIIEKNYRNKYGEIDIIARNGEYIIFVEVKTRTNTKYGMPCEAVNQKKQLKIINSAYMYLDSKSISVNNYRFDVIEVLLNKSKINVSHIIDAFRP